MVHAQHTTILERYFKWVTISYYYSCTIGACHPATVADRSLVDENWLFIRRWAAAAKIEIIMAAVAAELSQQ